MHSENTSNPYPPLFVLVLPLEFVLNYSKNRNEKQMSLIPDPSKVLANILTTEKPWGRFIQYVLNQPVTVKILEIRAGEQVSYQFHHHRSELWIPLDEGACIRLEDEVLHPDPMEPVFIPQGTKHQLIGESQDYRILEIAFGNFDEEDIVRLADKYGRV